MQEKVVTSRTALVISNVKSCLEKKKDPEDQVSKRWIVMVYVWVLTMPSVTNRSSLRLISRACVPRAVAIDPKCSYLKQGCFGTHRSCYSSGTSHIHPIVPARIRSHMAKHITSACDFTFHHQTSPWFCTEFLWNRGGPGKCKLKQLCALYLICTENHSPFLLVASSFTI